MSIDAHRQHETDGTIDPIESPSIDDETAADDDEVHHSKEDSLNDREFELLIEATYQMKDLQDLETRTICFLAGRLGMRAGEITHMTEEWIDWRRCMIDIPSEQECRRGRDGGQCGACTQAAKQKAATRVDNYCERVWDHIDEDDPMEPGIYLRPSEFITHEAFLDGYWRPKTECSVREIPFDCCSRAEIVIERFFDRFDEWQTSQTTIGRRVKKAAERADELEPDDVKPHGLRATAATFFAARGLDVIALKSLMGWVKFATARCYIASTGENTARAIRNINA